MSKIRIQRGKTLNGTIPISGAKNAALPLLASSLLCDGTLTLRNVPALADVETITKLLEQHGVGIETDTGAKEERTGYGRRVALDASNITSLTAPYELVRTMRAAFLVLGPLLARFGEAKVSLPGGCAIGTRPVDMHLSALAEMGAEIELEGGYVLAKVNGKLKGAEIQFDKVSVGATQNVLMAATLAEGETIIGNAAREPEVVDLANCLIAMGADIEGIGTDRVTVRGVESLTSAEYRVVGDRIEAGTYATAVALTRGEAELVGIEAQHLLSVIEKYEQAGVRFAETEDGLMVSGKGDLVGVDMMTVPHPGFPTDMQAQFMALMSLADGASMITETIFENRFMHVPELKRMGASINVQGRSAMVRGVKGLHGAEVMATDLRASSSLIIAALAAEGESMIHRVYHLDRGYENLEDKLSAVGAVVERVAE